MYVIQRFRWYAPRTSGATSEQFRRFWSKLLRSFPKTRFVWRFPHEGNLGEVLGQLPPQTPTSQNLLRRSSTRSPCGGCCFSLSDPLLYGAEASQLGAAAVSSSHAWRDGSILTSASMASSWTKWLESDLMQSRRPGLFYDVDLSNPGVENWTASLVRGLNICKMQARDKENANMGRFSVGISLAQYDVAISTFWTWSHF